MKKAYNILFSALALLAVGPISHAQSQAEKERLYYTDYGNGVGYSKTISSPDTNGVYTITLESFVTGNVTKKDFSAPVDIVLVLDVSTSMTATRSNNVTRISQQTPLSFNEVVHSSTNYLYRAAGNTANPTCYQLSGQKYNGKYYLYVAHYQIANSRHYVYLKADGTLTNGQASLIPPADAASSDLPDGVITTFANNNNRLYSGETRLSALEDAVCDFIDEINTNDLNDKQFDEDGKVVIDPATDKPVLVPRDERRGNRISIITFAGSQDTTKHVNLSYFTDSNVTEFKTITEEFLVTQGTYAGNGMTAARNQFKGFPRPGEVTKDYTRVVVLFTDGEPSDNWAAIGVAKNIKETDKADVFTVGMFDTTPGTNEQKYIGLNYISSNFPHASNINTQGADGAYGKGFYYDASGAEADLSAVFVAIAGQASSSANTQMSSSVTSVDVVSASFTLPKNAVESDIKVFTAPVVGIMKSTSGADTTYTATPEHPEDTTPKHWFKFGNEIPVPDNDYKYKKIVDGVEKTYDIDDSVQVRLSKSDESLQKNNVIKVDGFDYSANFCSMTVNGTDTTYTGYKLIIKIPILMDSTAVGGPNVATNASGSGIYLNEDDPKPLVPFDPPHVSLPINIFINKIGLDVGESAKFIIQRKLKTDSTWGNVTSVFVTRHANQTTYEPTTKIIGLPVTDKDNREFEYRIVEQTEWGWSYSPVGNTTISTSDQISNPFQFTNNKGTLGGDLQIRHAESKTTNVFKPGVTTGAYDDSKSNNRTVIGD